ncbi:MAG: protein-disulfide reductase DsbD domain-containing protein [Pseudomonadota bacterium]
MSARFASLALILTCLFSVNPAAAQDFPINGVAAFEILPGYKAKGRHMMAARVRMKPGWKTYWRAPGGNGIPPVFDWSGSENIKSVRFHWPSPKVYVENGVRTIGYTSELVLPIEVTPKRAGAPVRVAGSISFGICEDICLPVEARFSADLSNTDSNKSVIKSALAARPVTANKAGVRGVACEIKPVPDGMHVAAKMQVPGVGPGHLVVLEYAGAQIWAEQDRTAIKGTAVLAGATLYPLTKAPLIIDRSKLRMTVLGGAKAIEIRGCPAG